MEDKTIELYGWGDKILQKKLPVDAVICTALRIKDCSVNEKSKNKSAYLLYFSYFTLKRLIKSFQWIPIKAIDNEISSVCDYEEDDDILAEEVEEENIKVLTKPVAKSVMPSWLVENPSRDKQLCNKFGYEYKPYNSTTNELDTNSTMTRG